MDLFYSIVGLTMCRMYDYTGSIKTTTSGKPDWHSELSKPDKPYHWVDIGFYSMMYFKKSSTGYLQQTKRFDDFFNFTYHWHKTSYYRRIPGGFYKSMQSLIAWFMGPTWGPSGATGPRWAPSWPHEFCYLGYLPALWPPPFVPQW